MRCLVLLVTIFVATLHASLALINACAETTVYVEARGCKGRMSDVCCSAEGCVDVTARGVSYPTNVCWICDEDPIEDPFDDPFEDPFDILEDGCWIKYTFGNRQALAAMRIDFKEGAEDILKLYVDGTYHSTIKPDGETYVTQDFVTGDTTEVKFYPEDDEYDGDMWLGIGEVKFAVK